jgi:ribonuclease HI
MRVGIDDYVNPGTINIFTDASMWPAKNDTGCYGFLTMNMNTEINYGVYIDTQSTSNKCEIKGVKTGVAEAIRLRRSGFMGVINIFCDSQVSIFGIRDWIFDWKFNGQQIINKSGNVVSNQNEFVEIVRMIIENNPNINFYHQKGHVNIHNKRDVFIARDLFRKSNFKSNTEIDIALIKYLSVCNDQIDDRTRWYLKNVADISKDYKDPFIFVPTSDYNQQIHTYNMITGRKYNV